jgi:fructose-bisphosphate aldolase class I
MKNPAPESTVLGLLADGKGLLAADESLATIGRRFEAYNIPSTEGNRRAYREALFSAPWLSKYISGGILFDETIRQAFALGPAPEALKKSGIIAGIKVDKGTVPLSRFPGDRMTEGLDGLGARLAEYRKLGARFTKWRAVFSVGSGRPSFQCIRNSTRALALFASMNQDNGLVPIVEPETLVEGDHPMSACDETMHHILLELFASFYEYRVDLETMLLKTGMVLPGSGSLEQPEPAAIAEATLSCLRRSVPSAVPGIVFLSGGQGEVAATRRLNAICASKDRPWKLSFSFGRALQNQAMSAWRGLPANLVAARSAVLHRAHCNGMATTGSYTEEIELEQPSQESLLASQ